jgi:predicted  nucleic acid-binding Zn-ribbon protein
MIPPSPDFIERVRSVDAAAAAEIEYLIAEFAEEKSGSELISRQLMYACEKVNDLKRETVRLRDKLASAQKALDVFQEGNRTLREEITRLRTNFARPELAEAKLSAKNWEKIAERQLVVLRQYTNEIARLTDEKRLAEIAGWALCKHSEGGGPGKCDLMACACGPEGAAVAKAICAALSPRPPEGKGE